MIPESDHNITMDAITLSFMLTMSLIGLCLIAFGIIGMWRQRQINMAIRDSERLCRAIRRDVDKAFSDK